MRTENEAQSMQYRVYDVLVARTMVCSLEQWTQIRPITITVEAGTQLRAIFTRYLWFIDVGPYLFPAKDEDLVVLNQDEQTLRLPYRLWGKVPRLGCPFKVQTVEMTRPVHEWMNNPLLQLAYSEET